MAAVPKRRISTARKGKRREGDKLTKINVVKCKKCGAPHRSHKICPECEKNSK
ncbi:MAG TPA: 50S ribosomal protein L32 [Candidatus Dojkabacteria bacterium]|nr:50S ribosomal protein L32 [Candidatus Dojkabacteria bacterium]